MHEHCSPVRGRERRLQPVDRSAPKCCLDDYYLLLLALASCCSALLGVLRYWDPTLLPPATAALAQAGRFGAWLRRRCFWTLFCGHSSTAFLPCTSKPCKRYALGHAQLPVCILHTSMPYWPVRAHCRHQHWCCSYQVIRPFLVSCSVRTASLWKQSSQQPKKWKEDCNVGTRCEPGRLPQNNAGLHLSGRQQCASCSSSYTIMLAPGAQLSTLCCAHSNL